MAADPAEALAEHKRHCNFCRALLWCGEGTELARAWRRWLRDQAGNQPAPTGPVQEDGTP